MAKKLAIDWDESELRLVAAQCNGNNVKVTHTAVIPLADSSVIEVLRAAIAEHQLANTETLIAIGRGQAELRELQLPVVPEDELPDIVRFQAIRSFASAGDSATVDYLVTKNDKENIGVIAAAIGPPMLKEIHETCESSELVTKRISLRPLAAAALYQIHHKHSTGDIVLIDLLASDAEIVVLRDERVVFVRTVRMPNDPSTRGKALAGELRRSLVACGSTGQLERVVLWGRESVHGDDKEMLAAAANSPIDLIDPFDLVTVDQKTKSELPDHVGRLAPLVGLLAADETHADRLIDFLNPRKRVEEKPHPLRKVLTYGLPIAAALLIGFFAYRYLQNKDKEIASLQKTIAGMKTDVDLAQQSIEKTDTVDIFLDGNVNWLDEMSRLAKNMPPSDEMIVRSLAGTTNPRGGGGVLTVEGAVTKPEVIEYFEDSLRDESHKVTGDGASSLKTKDSYRLGFSESIAISAATIRNQRYAAINELLAAEAAGSNSHATTAESPPDEPPPEENAEEPSSESAATSEPTSATSASKPSSASEPATSQPEETGVEL